MGCLAEVAKGVAEGESLEMRGGGLGVRSGGLGVKGWATVGLGLVGCLAEVAEGVAEGEGEIDGVCK